MGLVYFRTNSDSEVVPNVPRRKVIFWLSATFGIVIQNGIGTGKDLIEGAFWHNEVARQGHACA
ncbi:hypothetical protein BDF20DRAFT_871101 [Mycotypha africana]|uniref:uncharacterized protein n=1 Tax=Mycotypha africana TaxID=64632 RepID=UPI0022FFCA75|nr:uncharacterized protein BDF20DRAFT_871101 [Mycotypha africana]KAI8979698.1 hypothetical protein BDF20DRAFT_871101 [Mycotypha africana]